MVRSRRRKTASRRKWNTSRPFLLDVVQDVSGLGVRCYAVPRRYAAAPLAEQLIGYLDSEGHGAAGLEAALDDVLYTGERDTLHCAVTAQGRLQRGSEPILEKADSAPQGVRLTLSRSIQRAAEGVAAESMATGCILIIDVSSGKVRACVSLPGFDAANVGESLTAPDSPLLNRAFSAYAVGSVFKPVLAAAALEAGEGDFIRECPGYDALNGQVYRCAGSVPHGLVGLDGALEKSCNGYFIELGRKLGPERVRKMAAALGFGKGQDIADGLRSASGVLPEAETLENEGQFANFCFGQGELLATPLQVAGMMNTIAAGGVYHTPLFVECTVDETTGGELMPLAHSSSRRVFAEQTAEKLQKLLNVYLDYPVNAMTRVCKKLNLPKKAALEAIHQFEVTYGGGPATAHDVFLAMQEIPFFLSCDHAPESKLLAVAESLARALTFRWEDYDLAKGVEY